MREIRRILPRHDLIYLGDTARFPYGTQSPAVLKRYAKEDADFLIQHGAKIIVIACNSASAAASDYLREKISLPVFDVIGPAIFRAKKKTRGGRIGVIGTKATLRSGIYESLLRDQEERYTIISAAAPLLVPLVEERGWKYPEAKRITRRYLRPFKVARVDTLILACTHYPILQTMIEKIMGPKTVIVNPAVALAAALKDFFEQENDIDAALGKNGVLKMYVTDDSDSFKKTAAWWLGSGEKLKVEEAEVGNNP